MADLWELLAGALAAAPVPASSAGIVTTAGGRTELVRAISGLPGPPRREDYASAEAFELARRRWRTASRQMQRAAPTTSSASARSIRLSPEARGQVQLIADRQRRTRMRRGAWMRVRGLVRISQDTRWRTMPAGGPAQWIEAAAMRRVIDLVDQNAAAAAGVLWVAFEEGYDVAGVVVEDFDWLRLWPRGEPEPVGPRR